jgi:hypothetical protein
MKYIDIKEVLCFLGQKLKEQFLKSPYCAISIFLSACTILFMFIGSVSGNQKISDFGGNIFVFALVGTPLYFVSYVVLMLCRESTRESLRILFRNKDTRKETV